MSHCSFAPNLQTTLTPADFASAQVDFVPHSLRDVKLQKSDTAWADIGGQYWSGLLSLTRQVAACGHRATPSCLGQTR